MTEESTRGDILKKFARQIEAEMFTTITGPTRKRPQTVLRARGNGFEVVELDDAGNVIEPPPPCCRSWGVLHAPNCKSWGIT